MAEEEPTYGEALIIGWSLLWRGVGSFLLLLFLANLAIFAFLPELTRTGPSWWALLLPLMIVTALSASFIMPLVVRRLLSTSFGRFHLQFVRDAPPSAAARRSGHDTDRDNGNRSRLMPHADMGSGAGRRTG